MQIFNGVKPTSMPNELPSAEFPFEYKYIEVKGHKIAYIEEGEGDPIPVHSRRAHIRVPVAEHHTPG